MSNSPKSPEPTVTVPTSSPASLKTKYYTTNTDLYNGWAATYDTDGNVLPMVDDIVFNERVVPLLQQTSNDTQGATVVRALEIGCGTGRNTVKLKQLLPPGSVIYAIDVSDGMLQEAQKKAQALGSDSDSPKLEWALLDIQSQRPELDAFVGGPVDIIVSTLVLEHVGLDAFFSSAGALLKPGGWAWISTMHPQIGARTEAGYRRSGDGIRVQGISHNHEIQDVVSAAKLHGLEVEGDIVETGVGDEESEAVAKFGPRATKWVGWQIFVGLLFRKK